MDRRPARPLQLDGAPATEDEHPARLPGRLRRRAVLLAARNLGRVRVLQAGGDDCAGGRGAEARDVGAQPYDPQRTGAYSRRPGLSDYAPQPERVQFCGNTGYDGDCHACAVLYERRCLSAECQNSQGASRQGVWEVRQGSSVARAY